jgi:mRNA interferase HigB
MRVISLKTLKAFWLKHPDAEEPLRAWFKVTTAAGWSNFMTVRNTFGSADTAKVNSGNTVTIFDIGGNKYRLITAIHYNTQCVYALLVLTHQEYSKGKWKYQL